MHWRDAWEEHRQSLVADFREFFHVSAYSVPNELSLNEAFDLYVALRGMTHSRIYGAFGEVQNVSLEDMLLMRVHNAIIASIPSKENSKKKKMMIEIPQPKSADTKKKMGPATAKKFFAHVRVAEDPKVPIEITQE